ncbi:sensor histidine kinase [Phocaeicola dorei]|uniref:histidine kinase n=2 Tax=Phocaeicola dorei TaxID=357276 RepID=B6W415_9BACT|nr:HAMP domain-containing sensor histidine kinase [Phocaeicola dorei]EEB23206.1 ATPase/histidine kinase/DNA gyrase B/HSP90 domain protein [Phocaeicola dorei DSM 17855]QJR76379.1 two-component sensor histidine kinase [Phocaeicola dorei]UWN81140.1 HAMP domain-containing histidine kinase [Phocaeicola dorei]
MPIGCVLFLFYYLCSEFLEIILKEMRGLAIIFRFFMLLVLLLPVVALCPVKAETTLEGPILIVTSYNPETRSISDNLSALMDEYRQRGGKYTPIIESMNCKNLSEAYLWKSRMASILGKYKGKNRPSLVILLGQEAWSAYISQDTEIAKKTPSICGMVSVNGLVLPDDSIDTRVWEPESKNIYTDFGDYNIVAGYVYEYDVDKNIELMRRFYPDMRRVAFISDNTYGGLSMQALVKKEMEKYPDLETIWLDGRTETFMEVSERMRRLPQNTCVLLGTWRVDCTESYVIGNTTYMLRDANPTLPVFTIASVGLGHWALGGYTPEYHAVGKNIGAVTYDFLDKGDREGVDLVTIPGNYTFDIKRLHEFKLDSLNLPQGAVLVNKTPSLYEQYKYWVIGVVSAFMFLIVCFLIAIYYIIRINHLKHHLEVSGEELLVAKEKAEESNRLKTAFLANMSHEIRTPLNAIVGFSSVLVSDDSSPAEKAQYCDIIQKNSDLLLHLINDILDISRMESGKIKFVWEECDVVELCQTALSTAEYGRKTSALFLFETPVASLVIKTDAQRLKQVLINLLSNAAKFTPSGSIKLAIAIDKQHQQLELSVSDTGCGIPSDKSDRVFERFEKLNEYSQGTGLGLAISRLIVENLGGKIWVDKDYTEGARFVFTHPLTKKEKE